ncbi:unnamed protein product, partial [marine sediment metagenome]
IGQGIMSKYNMELAPMKSRIETNDPTKTVDWRLHLDLLETKYRSMPRMNSVGGSRKKLRQGSSS